ncbi:PIN domain-like protein [Agrocybe pediades]|nr:PIN domain-like protein [Agrocybe pediades]
MAECTGATFAAGVNGQFEGGALRHLYNRLYHLALLPVTLVFVYDGAGRPSIKRGHSLVDAPLWWVNHSKALVQAFGYHVHEAPGEAEAELAMLNQLGMIDAVVTNDSDAVLFGAVVIYKSIPRDQREYDDQVLKYDAGDAEDEIGFYKGTALLIALMAGGDYDRRGIYGCGFTVARDLAKCGFGDSLIEAYERLRDNHFHDFTGFLIEWRATLRLELCRNTQGKLSQRCPAIAASIPDSFPSVDILDLYLKPLTSSSTPAGVPDHGRWIHHEISLSLIVQFCVQHLGWTTLADLRQHFEPSLWAGIFLRMVYLVSHSESSRSPRLMLRIFPRSFSQSLSITPVLDFSPHQMLMLESLLLS